MKLPRRLCLILGTVLLVVAGFLLVRSWLLRKDSGAYAIEVKTLYAKCGHVVSGEKAAADIVRKLQGARSSFGSWRLLQRGKGQIRLAHNVDALCPVCRRVRHLGIAQGMVAVFEGTPVQHGCLLETTKIPVIALPSEEKKDLERGIVFRSEEERLQLLEGLAALLNE